MLFLKFLTWLAISILSLVAAYFVFMIVAGPHADLISTEYFGFMALPIIYVIRLFCFALVFIFPVWLVKKLF
ncbi:MAG: hypothetical protein ACI9TY_000010 [Alphaproteobacteria bacterium]|jgi:hypothetical protein